VALNRNIDGAQKSEYSTTALAIPPLAGIKLAAASPTRTDDAMPIATPMWNEVKDPYTSSTNDPGLVHE
jgi:hypothetical protein